MASRSPAAVIGIETESHEPEFVGLGEQAFGQLARLGGIACLRADFIRSELPNGVDDELLLFGGLEFDQTRASLSPGAALRRRSRAVCAIRKELGITQETRSDAINSPRLPHGAAAIRVAFLAHSFVASPEFFDRRKRRLNVDRTPTAVSEGAWHRQKHHQKRLWTGIFARSS